MFVVFVFVVVSYAMLLSRSSLFSTHWTIPFMWGPKKFLLENERRNVLRMKTKARRETGFSPSISTRLPKRSLAWFCLGLTRRNRRRSTTMLAATMCLQSNS